MKISGLHKFAWVFFALTLATTSLFAQGRRAGNMYVQNQQTNCLYGISGLTEKQQEQILKLETSHQEKMAALRTKRRSTVNAIEKNEIRGEMLKKVEAHRKEVKDVLNKEQQAQYDNLHAFGNYGKYQRFGNGRGQGNYAGRGYGNRQFNRGNRGRACMPNGNFRGNRAGNSYRYNYGYGNRAGNAYGNRTGYGNRGNNFRGRNANFGSGQGRFYNLNDSTCAGSRNVSDEGFEVIE